MCNEPFRAPVPFFSRPQREGPGDVGHEAATSTPGGPGRSAGQDALSSLSQRRLKIGCSRAASFVERMEEQGAAGPADHAGDREILFDAEAADAAG